MNERVTGEKNVPVLTFETPIADKVLASVDMLNDVGAVPAGTVETYGATPLDRVTTLMQQLDLRIRLLDLLREVPGGIPLEIASRTHDAFGKRFDGRGNANDENFVTSLMYARQDEIDYIFREMIDKAGLGHASTAELLLVREVMGIRSVELACITHPYHVDGGQLDDMRAAVDLGVLSVGGTVYDNPKPRYAVKESIGDTPESFDARLGFLVTRKRDIGILSDGTEIRERSSFILRTDMLPQYMQDVIAEIDPADPDWMKKVEAIDGLEEHISQLLELDMFDCAIPISTTAYAFNRKTAAMVTEYIKTLERERAELQAEMDRMIADMQGHGTIDMDSEEVRAQHAAAQAGIEAVRKLFNQEMPMFNEHGFSMKNRG